MKRGTMPRQKPGASRQDYATQAEFITSVQRRLGIASFDFDFAANKRNTKALRYWSTRDDSLSKTPEEWAAQLAPGEWGWLNPPFALIDPWAWHCARLRELERQVAFLVPAGVGANWFRDHIADQARVLFLNGRLCFIDNWRRTIDPATLKRGKGPPRFYTSAPLYPKDCILCLFSPAIEPGYEVWTWRV